MADEHETEHVVDDSKLKLPTVKLADGPVSTMEDDEEPFYKTRARLYRAADGELKERGTGEYKILRHKVSGQMRVVMRQDKTFKVVANHAIDPEVELIPHSASDKIFLYTARDFSEEELKEESFAIRVKDAEVAAEFKAKYDEARTAMAGATGSPAKVRPTGASAGGGGGAGGPAADDASVGTDPVPVVDSLEAIYGDTASEQTARYASVAEKFEAKYGCKPTFYVRAPGRVNLIGEHIDYHGYSVLPCALDHDIVIAAAVGDVADVEVANTSERFSAATFPSDPAAKVDIESGIQWWQYVQCGYKGAFEAAPVGTAPKAGLRLLVDGRVPPSAGVSSSSALVVASALVTAHANSISYTRLALGEAARACEGHIGTMGGGMDQAISCLAEVGKAFHIEFNPLRAHPVLLPPGAVLVVANSLCEASKAVTAASGYNRRVVEGKLAAKLTAKKAGIADWQSIDTISDLQKALGKSRPGDLVEPLTAHLKEDAYTIEELSGADNFGVDVASLLSGARNEAAANLVLSARADGYELLKRARHVASESERVLAFRDACAGEPSESQLTELGDLMNASHESCANDYECSAEGLDEVVDLAQLSGAFGARLTGAGWGGCAVALVPAAAVDEFKTAIAEGYFADKEYTGDISSVLFASKPGSGAAVYTPSE